MKKAWWFRTYRHEHFAFYYHLFYHTTQNGKKIKIVPENIKSHSAIAPFKEL